MDTLSQCANASDGSTNLQRLEYPNGIQFHIGSASCISSCWWLKLSSKILHMSFKKTARSISGCFFVYLNVRLLA